MRAVTGGVVPPVITPLTADRRFDVASFENVVERMLAAGVDGIFVLVSTGEVAFATDELRSRVIAEARRIVGDRVPLLAGVIDTQTDRVLEQVRRAQDAGADAVVATAPFYAVTHTPQVARHFEVLGEQAAVPVLAYDIPVCVHTKLDPDMLVELGRAGPDQRLQVPGRGRPPASPGSGRRSSAGRRALGCPVPHRRRRTR